jgi:hypothetical protein
MTGKLILAGLQERLKVYAGIVLLYLLYIVVSNAYVPTPQMDNLLDGFLLSYEVHGVRIDVGTFLVLDMAAAALLVAEMIIFARDFYSPHAYLLFSLPVNGKNVFGSRLGLFILDFLVLAALDFPFRLPFYRSFLTSAISGEIGSWTRFTPWLTTSDWLNIGILAGLTLILLFTIVPLLAYLLIAVAKCVFDLRAGWLPAFVALGIGAFTGLCYILVSAMPPTSTTFDTHPYLLVLLLLVLLLIVNVLIFWSGTMVIDRKLNI